MLGKSGDVTYIFQFNYIGVIAILRFKYSRILHSNIMPCKTLPYCLEYGIMSLFIIGGSIYAFWL